MTKTVVNLASAYKGYKMITPKGKVEFKDGVAKVEFDKPEEAKAFVEQIKANAALTPYVRVVGEKAAAEVARLNAASLGGIKAGAQTSEMPKIMPKGASLTPAEALAKAEEADSKDDSKEA